MANIVEIVIKAVDQTKKGFTGPIDSMKALERSASAMATVAVAAGAAVAGSLVALTSHAINAADEMGKLAQRVNIPVESLTRLAHAAELADISTEELQGGLNKLNKAIAEASRDGASDAAAAFAALGVSLTDAGGKAKTNEAIFLELSDRFAGFEDGANKAALAMAIFGKSGAQLLTLLNTGAAGIQEEGAGVVTITQKMANEAAQFNDNLTRLKRGLLDVGTQIAAELLPHLVALTNWLVKSARDTGTFSAIAMTALDILKGMAVAVHAVYTLFQALGIAIGAGAAILQSTMEARVRVIVGLFGAWFTAIKGVIAALQDAGRAALNASGVLAKIAEGEFGEAWDLAKQSAVDFGGAVKDAAGEVAQAVATSGQVIGDTFAQTWSDAKAITSNAAADIGKQLEALGKFSLDIFTPNAAKAPEIEGAALPKQEAPAIQTEAIRKALADAQQLAAQMRAEALSGAAALMAAEDLRHQKRLEQIEELARKGADTRELEALAEEEHQARLNDIRQQALDVRAEMDAAAKEGDIARAVAALESERGAFMADLQGRQEFIATYQQIWADAHRTVASYAAEGARTLQTGLGNALTGIITQTTTAKEAFRALGQQMVAMVVNFIAQKMIAFALEKVMAAAGKAIQTAAGAASAAQAVALAAAWTPAATAAAIATFGAATAAGAGVPAMMAANTATATSLAMAGGLGGVAHGGLDFVPRESTFLLDRGERVVQPSANRDLTEFLETNRGGGGGAAGSMTVSVYLDGDVLARGIGRMSEDGRLEINARAIV